MQRKSRSGGAGRTHPLPAAPHNPAAKSTKSSTPIIAPTCLSTLLASIPPHKMSKEEQSRRNRERAEVYALNAYLKEIEITNFNAFMASSRKKSLAAMSLNDNLSDCSDESTIHPSYHQKDLLSRRFKAVPDSTIPISFKNKKRVEIRSRPKFGGV